MTIVLHHWVIQKTILFVKETRLFAFMNRSNLLEVVEVDYVIENSTSLQDLFAEIIPNWFISIFF